MKRGSSRLTFVLSLSLLVAPTSDAMAQEGGEAVRVLFIPSGTVPARLRRTITNLLDSRADLVDYAAYARAAERRRLRPSSRNALRRIATQQGATVIAVASYGGHYRRRVLRVRFHDGETAEVLASGAHALRGQHLRASAQHAILRDLNQATGGRTGEGGETVPDEPAEGEEGEGEGEGEGTEEGEGDAPIEEDPDAVATGDGGLPPPLDWEAEEAAATGEAPDEAPVEEPTEETPSEETPSEGELPLAEQSQLGFAIAAGAGIMNRTASIPTEAGPATLSTMPFPAIQAEVIGYARPDANSRFRLELTARYTTSVGLVAQDQRADGSTRSTDMRAHHLRFGLGAHIPLAPGERPTVLLLELGWQFRMLDSEIEVSIPDYTLTGITARIGLWFVLGESPISIGIVPEIGHAMNVSEALSQAASVGDGFFVGAEAIVRAQLIREVALLLMYREAHAFLPSEHEGDLADAERYGILKAEYRF